MMMDSMKRIRTDQAVVAYGSLYLYFNSRSTCLHLNLEPIAKRTHVSIWKWVQRFSKCADRFRADKRSINVIFVDETHLLK